MRKYLIITILSFIVIPTRSFAWGFWAHKKINRQAVFILPPEMIDFYKEHIEYITEHAVDPDKRRYAIEGEAPKHYIDLDHYCTYPCDSFPKEWDDALATYGDSTLQTYGTVPWTIEQKMYQLTMAFEELDFEKILKHSADIGHYIGDSHVPLHTTENYNGQLTDQYGIHGFWESRLPELFNDDYDFFVGKAEYVRNPNEFIWENILLAHRALDTVLLYEKELDRQFPPDQKYSYETRGETLVKTYSEAYSKVYHALLKGMVERQMRLSIKHVGDVWFTCWVNAGQPNLSLIKENEVEEIQEEKLKENTVESRPHAETGNDIFEEE
ncbi:MAG: zinc dependent phospholipase C family protein [Chitinophagales bacterium]